MFRVSLRELLLLVAAVAVAIVSLKYASETWVAIVAGLAMLAFFVAIIVAAVDRGRRQAFALGFALVVIAYGLIVLNMPVTYRVNNQPAGTMELDQWEGRLPTTRLLRYVHVAVDDSEYVDDATGKVLSNYDATTDGPLRLGGGGFGTPSVSFRERPPREHFMPIGHLWWAMLFGYVGGRFARFLYLRRTKRNGPAA